VRAGAGGGRGHMVTIRSSDGRVRALGAPGCRLGVQNGLSHYLYPFDSNAHFLRLNPATDSPTPYWSSASTARFTTLSRPTVWPTASSPRDRTAHALHALPAGALPPQQAHYSRVAA
jgi:hypothetical protein